MPPGLYGALAGRVRGWDLRFEDRRDEAHFKVYGAVAIVVGQTHHLTLALGYDFATTWQGIASTSEAWILLGLNLLSTVVFLQLRIRVILSLLVPLAGGLTFIITSACLLDARYTHVLYSLAMMSLSYIAWGGSCRNERHMRAEWLAMQSVQVKDDEIHEKELEIMEHIRSVNLMHQVAGVFCDVLINLSQDLTIHCPDETCQMFFERPVNGIPFLELLRGEDADRFRACVSRATTSQSPELVLVTLHRRYTISEAQLLLLDTGAESLRYMLGVRVERDHPPQTLSEGRGWDSGEEIVPLRTGEIESHAAAQSDMLLVMQQADHGLPGVPLQDVTPSSATGASAQQGDRSRSNSVLPMARAMCAIDENSESNFHGSCDLARPTGCPARCATMRSILRRWMVPHSPTSCCRFHTTVASIAEVFDVFLEEPCNDKFGPFPEQCRRCLCMNIAPACVVCGYANSQELG